MRKISKKMWVVIVLASLAVGAGTAAALGTAQLYRASHTGDQSSPSVRK